MKQAYFAFKIEELEEFSTLLLAEAKGDNLAVKSAIEETQSAITCPELKAAVTEMKGALREKRAELHFRIASHRDARYSLAGSQFTLRMALWNRLRAQYETARAAAPFEIFDGD